MVIMSFEGTLEWVWKGLSTDLVIEQTMRSIKSTGGLTGGSGFGNAQRNTWLPITTGVSGNCRGNGVVH